jgi:hypothetical protein
MGIEDGEEVKANDVDNIFNKIIAENVTNLKKELSIHVQEPTRTPNRHEQNRTSLWHIIVKTISTENKERTLKAGKEKNKII